MRVFRFFILGVATVGSLATTAESSAGMGVASAAVSRSAMSAGLVGHGVESPGPAVHALSPNVPLTTSSWQSRTITGTVSDSLSGELLTAGQVLVVGTRIGVLVRPDGRFTISVPCGPSPSRSDPLATSPGSSRSRRTRAP